MIITAKGCWDAAKQDHTLYFDSVVKKNIQRFENVLPKNIYDFLIENHEDIRDGNETEFRQIQGQLDGLLKPLTAAQRADVNENFKKIYDYTNFQTKNKVQWCAYKLCEKVSVLTCPYCNLAFGHTIRQGQEGKMRPTLDHFLDKAKYPLFGISLGNLVPSCHPCNSSLKGTKNFLKKLHLNPLTSDEKITISLEVDVIRARFDLTVFDAAKMQLNYDGSDIRTKNSVKTFCLVERYQRIAEEARSIAQRMASYVAPIAPSAEDVERLSDIRRGVTNVNYRDRIMGKMILDFSREYLNP